MDTKELENMINEGLAASKGGYDEQIKGYQESQVKEMAALEAQRANQENKLKADRQSSQQDAYVSKRMAEKNMPQLLAAQGITGGMAETTASNVFNDYLKAKTKADSIYSTASNDLQSNFMTNSANLSTKYTQLLNEAQQKKRDDAWTRMQWAYQTAVAEEERKRQEQERAAAAARKSSGRGTSRSNKSDKPGNQITDGYVSPYATQVKEQGGYWDVDGYWRDANGTRTRKRK